MSFVVSANDPEPILTPYRARLSQKNDIIELRTIATSVDWDQRRSSVKMDDIADYYLGERLDGTASGQYVFSNLYKKLKLFLNPDRSRYSRL